MGDQPVTREDLEGTTTAFFEVLTTLTEWMSNLANRMNNAFNNGNQQIDMEMNHYRP